MNKKEQRKAAEAFAKRWQGRGYEKGESQKFWIDLLVNVLGISDIAGFISFEDQVHLDHTSFIDGYIPSTHVMIEQKSLGKDLRKAIKQSDGSLLNPFQQAKRYSAELPYDDRPRWIVTCNFEEFLIYDMNKPNGEPEQVFLKDLPKEYYRLQFLVDTGNVNLQKETEISLKAGELVGKLYDSILKQYKDPKNPDTLKALNMLCVRLVFCLYAEDAGIFGQHEMFGRYLKQFSVKDVRKALIELFRVLDTKPEERDPYMDDELAAFPYVNGGLFADENIEIPRFTDEIVNLLVNKASAGFDWSEISPTIFGAVFESTLNPETRRAGGMHYTSIENIHKVIDPLFLDALKTEFAEISELKIEKTRRTRLEQFCDKLSSLIFLDPACGSGNFLTETYICLRKLENQALKLIHQGQLLIGGEGEFDPIKVGIGQFYGIEINDFAVTVAKTALWIAESQMLHETEQIVNHDIDFLPLKSYANIVEGNALRIDWESVVPKDKLNYIIGNPPFVGQQLRTKEQSDDMSEIFGKGNPETKLDYVLCWYKKALDLINSIGKSKVKVAFVSTNSICQGESVPTFWKKMFDESVDIGFAHKSFKWTSESSNNAAVICVIVGFSNGTYTGEKWIFDSTKKTKTNHINAYLQSAPDVWIISRQNTPPLGLPKMIKGSEPSDGRGNLFISQEQKNVLENKYPTLKKYIKPFVGSDEFLSNKQGTYSRYCLWFYNSNPADFANIKEIKERLKKVADAREKSSADRIRKRAEYPYLFCQIRQPETNYLIFPRHSSGERKYIPIGYMDPEVIVGDACYILPDTPIYLFGILTSNVHMAWTRLVCGRLGNGYRYSPAIYNNFPFPNLEEKYKVQIEHTAQAILDARALYPDCSLADLYDETTMPPELRKAHQQNDKAVMLAYGFDYKKMTESECVAELMKMYQRLTNEGK